MQFIGDSVIDIPVVTTEETSCVVGSSMQIGYHGSRCRIICPLMVHFLKWNILSKDKNDYE